MLLRALACCLLSLTALTALPLYAKSIYRIGTQDFDYSPHYNFSGKGSRAYAEDVLDRFAAAHNIRFVYTPLPLKRLQPELQRGNVDFVYPDNLRWHEGEQDHRDRQFSLPLAVAVYGTMVRPEQFNRHPDSFRSVAYPRGFVPTKWRKMIEEKKLMLVETSTAELAIKMALRGRADGADIEYSVSHFLLQQLNAHGGLVIDRTLPYTTIGFRLSTIRHGNIIKQLNLFLQREEKMLSKLKKDYGIITPTTPLTTHP